MALETSKKRKIHDNLKSRAQPNKKFKKQKHYSSGSEDASDDEHFATDAPPTTAFKSLPPKKSALKKNPQKFPENPTSPSEASEVSENGDEEDEHDDEGDTEVSEGGLREESDSMTDSASDSDSNPNHTKLRSRSKRHDPSAFASSLSTILSSKLTTTQRADPVLARSATAAEASHELAESKLEARARKKLREDKRVAQDRGRVRDVLLGDRITSEGDTLNEKGGLYEGDEEGMSAAQIAEQERRLRKTAQKGVVKLFNAVRAAQVKGEEAAKEVRKKGVVGTKRREEKVGEMGRKAFLDLVGAGGKV